MPKSSLEQYQEFQDYTNYIDTSDVMLGFYKNQTGTGLEKYYLMIEEWLAQDVPVEQNKPLVIQADGGVGKKTLLANWFEYHQALRTPSKQDLIILHFATTGGNNSNYFYAIYRILIKLREELNIGQKVELHQEKLRKYFSYWLDVCDQRINNQVIQNVETSFEKIILVFQGIDYFLDRATGKEGNIAFWLPKCFPKHVKVIVTADRESQSMRYFDKLGCAKVSIPYDLSIMKSMIRGQIQKGLCVEGQIKTQLVGILEDHIRHVQVTSLFVKSYLSCLLPEQVKELELAPESLRKLQVNIEKINQSRLRQIRNVDELFGYLLQFWSGILFASQQKFKELIGLLISTQKGLTRSEIIQITKIEAEELKLFITIFRSFLMNFKDLWMIKNDSFKKSIDKKYEFSGSQISDRIAETLKKSPNSVRKLEEETFQLYSAGNYFKLKEVISDIENFLLLFNPYTKYDLCRYWQKLEQRSFDPVIEYNKAIEGFEMHYHPTSDDLFRIITQISRFLRQFSDFETYYTPNFRHPQVIGNLKQLNDIGILAQFRNLALCQDPEQDQPVKQEEEPQEHLESQDSKKKQKECQKKEAPKGVSPACASQKTKTCRIQQLNVEVKSNEDNFRAHYYHEIKPFLEKVCLEGSKETVFVLDEGKDEDYEDSDEDTGVKRPIRSLSRERSKPEDIKDLKQLYARTVEEQFELNQKPPTNYYYKRWIWMQFPWVCMTMKCDYSDKLRKCFTSPTSYMSVSEEREFTIQALKIALEAKNKKQAILEKVEDVPRKLKPPSLNSLVKIKAIDTVYEKLADRENNFKAKPFRKDLRPKRMEDIAMITTSFLSLHNLSKEMKMLGMAEEQSKASVFITTGGLSQVNHSIAKKKNQNQSEMQISLVGGNKEGLLPRIKQTVHREMQSELQELQKRNVVMRREIDGYLYKNKILAKQLKELKIIHSNSVNQTKNERKIEEKKARVAQLEAKIEKVKEQYNQSQLEHERLNVLIKICRMNKTHNQESIPELVTECNNFKRMIRIQSDAIAELRKKTEEIKKLTKKFLANCTQKMQNQATLQREIDHTIENHQQFHQQLDRYDSLVDLAQTRLNPADPSRHYTQPDHHDKPRKRLQETNYHALYAQIGQHIDLDNPDFRADSKYQHLLDAFSKKREFETVFEERKNSLEQLRKVHALHKRQLEILMRAKEDSTEIKSQPEEPSECEPECVESEEQLLKDVQDSKRVLGKMTDMRLSCLGMLNTLYSRLGLPEQQKLVITSEFREKLEEARVMSQVQSC